MTCASFRKEPCKHRALLQKRPTNSGIVFLLHKSVACVWLKEPYVSMALLRRFVCLCCGRELVLLWLFCKRALSLYGSVAEEKLCFCETFAKEPHVCVALLRKPPDACLWLFCKSNLGKGRLVCMALLWKRPCASMALCK